jgi:hypothetical protein
MSRIGALPQGTPRGRPDAGRGFLPGVDALMAGARYRGTANPRPTEPEANDGCSRANAPL